MSRASEGLELLRLLDILLGMLFDFHIHLLARQDIHDVQRCSSLPNQVQDFGISWIVDPVQFTIVNTEAILPEV
jgi:hypothetical protein